MSKPTTFTVVDEEGNALNRRRIAQRLAEMNERFPPREGWSVQVEAFPTEQLVQSARGMPAVSHALRFVAKLVDPQGRVVRTGSTLAAIEGWKAYEAAETNAIARLLEFAGIASGVTEEDELAELARNGLRVAAPAAATEVAAAVVAAAPVVPQSGALPAGAAEVPIPPERRAQPADAPPAARVAAGNPVERARAAKDPEGAPRPATVAAIRSLARQLHVPVADPPPATEAEALAQLRELQAKRGHGRGNGATPS